MAHSEGRWYEGERNKTWETIPPTNNPFSSNIEKPLIEKVLKDSTVMPEFHVYFKVSWVVSGEH